MSFPPRRVVARQRMFGSLLALGLAASVVPSALLSLSQSPAVASSVATVDDGPTPVPVRPIPELPPFTGQANGYDALGDTTADLPQPETSTVVSDESWQDVPGLPIDVRQTPELADELDNDATPAAASSGDGGVATAVPAVWTGGASDAAPASVEESSDLPVDVTIHEPGKVGDIVLSVLAAEDAGATTTASTAAVHPASTGALDEGEGLSEGDSVPGIKVRVSYAEYAHVFGGRWADRLVATAYPACFVVTPDDPDCSTGTVLPVVNDADGQTLTFTTPETDAVAGAQPAAVHAKAALPGATRSAAHTAAALAPANGGTVVTVHGGSGTFGATPLAVGSSWQVGAGSGSFSYSYPFEIPAAWDGTKPDLSLNYSSSVVDGMTTADNGQGSQDGLGWTLNPGEITRSYTPCALEGSAAQGNRMAAYGDLCWQNANGDLVNELDITLNGHSSRLIRVGAAGSTDQGAFSNAVVNYRLEDDPGWRVTRYRNASPTSSQPDNESPQNEAFQVTAKDGTQYWFGWGWQNTSGSTLIVPVFAGQPGQPCYNATIASSACWQPWRWSLDKVVTPTGRVIKYTYGLETNYYSMLHETANIVPYNRANVLQRVEYGLTSDGVFRNKVDLGTTKRCIPSLEDPTVDCSTGNAQDWPDVPLDLLCTASSTCTVGSPSFFTTLRHSGVTTSIKQGNGSYQVKDKYTFTHNMPDPDTAEPDSQADMFLRYIYRTGSPDSSGNGTTLPRVDFNGIAYPNRVVTDPASNDHRPALMHFRFSYVLNEFGGQTNVYYGHASADKTCSSTNLPATHSASNKECFLTYWTPEGGTLKYEYFHKYVVTEAVTSDDSLGSRYKVDSGVTVPASTLTYNGYEYQGNPGWRYVNRDSVPATRRTWSDWRGYETTLIHTHKSTRQGSAQVVEPYDVALHRIVQYRGMNSNRDGSGAASTPVTVSTHEPSPASERSDDRWLQGRVAEEETLRPDGTMIARTYHRYKAWRTSYDPDGQDGRVVMEDLTRTTTSVFAEANPSGAPTGTRVHEVQREFDEGGGPDASINNIYTGLRVGELTQTTDFGLAGDPNDTQCTSVDYVGDSNKWMLRPNNSRTYDGTCAAGTLEARSQVFYDGDATGTPTLTNGLPTMTRTWSTPGHAMDALRTYDTYGRVTGTRTPKGYWTYTDYNPGGNASDVVTTMRVTNPKGHVVTTTLDARLGLPTSITDANANNTTVGYDGLGRMTSVRLPGNSSPSPPSLKVDYSVTAVAPTRVTTTRQRSGSATDKTVVFYDGWGREFESQVARADGNADGSNAVVFTATGYDELGQPRYSIPATPAGGTSFTVPVNAALSSVPRYTETSYDAASRPVETREKTYGSLRTTTTTTFLGDKTVTKPPLTGKVTTTLDGWDRPAKVEQYDGTYAEAFAAYDYTSLGNLKTITTTIASTPRTWAYTYDLAGRRISAVDPDTGSTAYDYDDDGNQTSVDDAAPAGPVTTSYDSLDRPTQQDGPTLATAGSPNKTWHTWTYDTATNGKGMLATTTSNTALGTFSVQPTGYDSRGRSAGTKWTYPNLAATPVTPGTYTETYGYDDADNLTSVTYPTVGNLQAETQTTSYAANGNLSAVATSNMPKLATVGYDNTNRANVLDSSFATGDYGLDRTYTWNPATGWLDNIQGLKTRTGAPPPDLNLAYNLDDIGRPRQIKATEQRTAIGGTQSAAWCYGYDSLNRLTSAATGQADGTPTAPTCRNERSSGAQPTDTATTTAVTGALYDLRYAYGQDRLGYVVSKAVTAASSAEPDAGYQYDDPNHAHATSSISVTSPAVAVAMGIPNGTTFAYDNAGRVTSANPVLPTGTPVTALGVTYTYDGLGRLFRTAPTTGVPAGMPADIAAGLGTTTDNAYNADGTRVARRTTTLAGAATTTIWMGATELTQAAPAAGGIGGVTVSARRHYTTPHGTPLAVQDDLTPDVGNATTDKDTWTLELADTQNTVRFTRAATTGATGDPATTDWLNYRPYGDPITPAPVAALTAPGGRTYLDKPIDANGDLRLDHRAYTPSYNILTTPDPLLDPGDPQSLNPYAYARNNPVSGMDPSGLMNAPISQVNGPGFALGFEPYSEVDLIEAQKKEAQGDSSAIDAMRYHAHAVAMVEFSYAPDGQENQAFADAIAYMIPPLSGEPPNYGDLHVASGSNLMRLVDEPPTTSPRGAINRAKSAIETPSPFSGSFAGQRGRPTENAANGAANVCGLKSFSGDTLVLMADGSKKPIDQIEVGDKVIATDPETGEQAAKSVLKVWVHGDSVVDLVMLDGTVLTTTEDHPFWSVTDQRFERADELSPGEQVLGADGQLITVSGLDFETTETAPAYNLTVDGLHTYHVGDDAVLVHNAGCMSSVIGNDPFLVKAAQNAGKNSQVQREMDGLFAQLSAGNMNPGIGTRTLSGTDISYARSRGGARLFFRNADGGIQIVGKASKANESSVIDYLMGIYGP